MYEFEFDRESYEDIYGIYSNTFMHLDTFGNSIDEMTGSYHIFNYEQRIPILIEIEEPMYMLK